MSAASGATTTNSPLVPQGTLLALDTPPFIYYLESYPFYIDIVRPLFADLVRGSIHAVTSVVTLTEVLVRPFQRNLSDVAEAYELFLTEYPHMEVLPVTRDVARRAAELRARYRLRAMDSLQVATALDAGASAFLTNDRGIARVTEVPVLILDDFRA